MKATAPNLANNDNLIIQYISNDLIDLSSLKSAIEVYHLTYIHWDWLKLFLTKINAFYELAIPGNFSVRFNPCQKTLEKSAAAVGRMVASETRIHSYNDISAQIF